MSILLFVVVLLATFGISMWVFSPTKAQSDIQRHLKEIGSLYTLEPGEGNILRRRSLSSVPWFDQLLHFLPSAERLQIFLAQAGSGWTVGTLLLSSLVSALVLAGVVRLLVPSWPIAILLAAAGGFAPYGFLFLKRRARFRRFESQLPDVIDLLARAIRAGHTIMSAIQIASEEKIEPLSSEFRAVYEEQSLGLPIREAIVNLVERMPLEDVRFLATAILVQKETGGNLAEILDKAAAVMRDRLRLKGQLRVYTAQGRITGWVLCLLPVVVLGLMLIVNPSYEKKLLTDPIGLRLVYADLVLMAVGILAIRKIISIKV